MAGLKLTRAVADPFLRSLTEPEATDSGVAPARRTPLRGSSRMENLATQASLQVRRTLMPARRARGSAGAPRIRNENRGGGARARAVVNVWSAPTTVVYAVDATRR